MITARDAPGTPKEFLKRELAAHHASDLLTEVPWIILSNHKVIGHNKFDLGHIDTLLHEIAPKTDKPAYIKHFKILDTHSEEVEKHITAQTSHNPTGQEQIQWPNFHSSQE